MLGAMITEEKTILFSLPVDKSEFVSKDYIKNHQLGWIINDDTTFGYIQKMPISKYYVGDHSLDDRDNFFNLPVEEIDSASVSELFGLLSEEPKVMTFKGVLKQ